MSSSSTASKYGSINSTAGSGSNVNRNIVGSGGGGGGGGGDSANIITKITGNLFGLTGRIFKQTTGPTILSIAERYRLATFPSHAGEAVTAFIAYTSLMHIVAPQLSKRLAPKQYNSLPPKTKINWHVRIVSFVQATFISVCALRVILNQRRERSLMGRDDRLWGYDSASGTVQAFAAGYFLWDVAVSAQHMGILGVSGFIHAICALLITMLGFRPFANYYGVNFVLYELSTPFLNIHWALDKLGMTGTAAQLYNGIALMASFFGCRLVWGSYQTWLLTKDIFSAWTAHRAGEPLVPRVVLVDGILRDPSGLSTAQYEFPAGLLLTYLVANTTLSALNFYWFGLMVQALRKRFSSPSASSPKPKASNAEQDVRNKGTKDE